MIEVEKTSLQTIRSTLCGHYMAAVEMISVCVCVVCVCVRSLEFGEDEVALWTDHQRLARRTHRRLFDFSLLLLSMSE